MTSLPAPQAAQLLNQLMATRDFARAKLVAEQIVATDPRHPDARRALGEITLMQGLWDEAQGHAQTLIAERPNDPVALLLGARVAQARGDTATTVALCDRALTAKAGDVNAILIKATTLERSGAWQDAEALLSPIINAPNPPPGASHVWALVLLRKGEMQAAARAIDAGLAQYSIFAPAPKPVKARMLFVKAKALDKLKDYDGAFQAALAAKASAAVPFDPAEFIARIDSIIAAFPPGRLATLPRASPTATRHIFIAGMPRSGTTLIEQILDAHPDGVGVGEAKEIDILASRMSSKIGSRAPYPACISELTADHVAMFRADYEEAQARHGFGPATVLVNKNLENYIHLGLIAMIFPDAKVIVPRREPRDIAVSCVMSNFKAEKHPYLSTLEHIALAYRQWDRLMAHWRTALDLDFLEVPYEKLVHDQESWTRQMLEFAGLSWDERCSRFWQSGRTVMTLSYDQVSRPMYDSSIGRWKNYEKHLAPFDAAMKN